MDFESSNRARRQILAKVRAARARGRPSAAQLEAVETYVRSRPRGPLPPLPGDPVARFRAAAESMQSSTGEVGHGREVPAAVARYLSGSALPLRGCVWPALRHLDWNGAGLELSPRAARDDDPVGVTGVFAALAETGTLMLVSGPDSPSSCSLLPETHIAVVPASRVVATMEDAWALARRICGDLPRAVTFISGPSRTGDIEQRMVLGVHGPYRVHILLIRNA